MEIHPHDLVVLRQHITRNPRIAPGIPFRVLLRMLRASWADKAAYLISAQPPIGRTLFLKTQVVYMLTNQGRLSRPISNLPRFMLVGVLNLPSLQEDSTEPCNCLYDVKLRCRWFTSSLHIRVGVLVLFFVSGS